MESTYFDINIAQDRVGEQMTEITIPISVKKNTDGFNFDFLCERVVDLFSQQTHALKTALVLKDNSSHRFVLKSVKQISGELFDSDIALTLIPGVSFQMERMVLDFSDALDIQYFDSIFEEGSKNVKELDCETVVLIFSQNGDFLGFVSLSKVQDTLETEAFHTLLHSISEYAFIIVEIAVLLQDEKNRRRLAETKLDNMIKVNKLIKNITGLSSVNTLIELALKTLETSFGVSEALIALYDRDSVLLQVAETIHVPLKDGFIALTERSRELKRGRILCEYGSLALKTTFGEELSVFIESKAGYLAIPLMIDKYEPVFIGVLMIFNQKRGSFTDEENFMVYEIMANQIAALVGTAQKIEKKILSLNNDPVEVFKKALEAAIDFSHIGYNDLEVVRIVDVNATPFTKKGVLQRLGDMPCGIYPVSYDQTFLIITKENELVRGLIVERLSGIEVLKESFLLNEDFADLDSFIMGVCGM
jgi:hypothetical protein